MSNELAMRTFAYLISNYKENNETIINSEEIEAIEFLIKENQELKKQLEETKNNYEKEKYIVDKQTRQLTDEYKNTEYQTNKAKELENQQKEFIEYLEYWRKAVKKQYKELNEPVKKSFLKVTIDTIEEILSKYKEIIGGKDE